MKIVLRMTGSFVDLLTIFHADFDFQTLYPCPYRDSLGEPTDNRYYEWCLEHWGNPDSAKDIIMSYDENNSILDVTFTSEQIPVGLFSYLKELYPLLEIQMLKT